MPTTSAPAPTADRDTAEGHPSPHRHRTSIGALWFALCGAPAAWSVQAVVDYAVAAHACYPTDEPLRVPIVGGLTWIVLGVSVAALAVAVAAGVAAWRAWRRTRDEQPGDGHVLLEIGEGRTRFMALSAIVVSVVFTLGIVFHVAALAFIRPCT